MVLPCSTWSTAVSRSTLKALWTLVLVVGTTGMWVQNGWAQEGASPAAASGAASVDEAAVAAFRRGTTAFEAGHFVEAAAAFEEAFELKPHAAAQFNAAKAWAKAGSRERAADLFMRALDRGELGAANAADARERLAQLRQQLGWLELVGDSELTVSVGSLKKVGLPVLTHLADGTHQIVCVTPDGESFVQEVVVSAGVGSVVRLEQDQNVGVAPQALVPTSPEPAGPPADPVKPTREEEHESTRSPRKTLGFALIGVGTALAGTSIGFGVATLRANSEYRDSDYTDADKREQVVAHKTRTNVLAVSAAVVGGAGVALVTTKRASKSSQVGLRLEPDEVVLEWIF